MSIESEVRKACSRCREEKGAADFYKDKRATDGLASCCKACHRGYQQRWAKANPEKMQEIRNRWIKANPDAPGAWAYAWRAENPEQWREICRRSRRRNRDKIAARGAIRKARKLRATPKWADKRAIEVFYRRAAELTKATGIEHHVDHIVPLQSRLVCGLHVEANLQVLPAAENLAKHNKYWPDMP